MGAARLAVRLANQSEWIKVFDPRDWTVFVRTELELAAGAPIDLELDVEGWLVTLFGSVAGRRREPAGIVVAVEGSEREKINYLNGYVRGGLINLRETRRLPLRLAVTYGALAGPMRTFTKDINEHGAFLFADEPLPEGSQLHMRITVPDEPQPLTVRGRVSHTISRRDGQRPGMGVVFELDAGQRARLSEVVNALERRLRDEKLSRGPAE